MALKYDERPADDTPIHTADLPADAGARPQHPGDGVDRGARRRSSTSATTCPAARWPTTSAGSGRGCCGGPGPPPAPMPATSRCGPTTSTVHHTFRLFPDGDGDGTGPSGERHTRFRTWKEDLRDHP